MRAPTLLPKPSVKDIGVACMAPGDSPLEGVPFVHRAQCFEAHIAVLKLRPLFLNYVVRAGVSGLGVLDFLIGVSEVRRLFRASRMVNAE